MKKETALHNMSTLMDSAHAVRCPGTYNLKIIIKMIKYLKKLISGPAATDIAWVGSGSADAFFHMGIHFFLLSENPHFGVFRVKIPTF